MHVVAWLLTQRAINSGEIEASAATRTNARLGHASDSDPEILAGLPDSARRLIAASTELYSRIKRLDDSQDIAVPPPSPARALMGRLERDFIGR
jgi:regulator of CtrA degradation